MSTFKNKNSLRTIEAQIVQKLKNNEARPKFTGSYKKKPVGIIKTSVYPAASTGEKSTVPKPIKSLKATQKVKDK